MDRRNFIRTCALGAATSGAAAAGVPVFALEKAAPRYYHRALLVDPQGRPVRSKSLAARRNFIFHYPYAGTPCFLLNLGKPARAAAALKTADARNYQWQGGVGANASVVAYSAICAHRLTYPTREISFISYRAESGPGNKHADVIHCCSEHSQYDPAEGGRVLAGPAPQPLAAILLEYDQATDGIHAVGTLGGEMFNEFFSKFDFKLALEHKGAAKKPAAERIVVSELTEYCRQQVKC
jgi:arsenite oxidase small subunit